MLLFKIGELSLFKGGCLQFLPLGLVVVPFGFAAPQLLPGFVQFAPGCSQLSPELGAFGLLSVQAGIVVKQRELEGFVGQKQAPVLGVNVKEALAERSEFACLCRAVVDKTARAAG